MGALTGKVALITGGGTGIGAGIADAYGAAGVAVAVTGRRPGPLADVTDRIVAAGGRAMSVPSDVCDLDAMTAAVDAIVDRFGRLDIVVANAGGSAPFAPVLDFTPELWREAIDVNLTGVWNTAKAAVPRLLEAGGGTIIVMGSGAGRANSGGLGPYSAAKAGVIALTRVLAAELRASNIAVNELVPGPVRTPAIGVLGSHDDGRDDDALTERIKGMGEWLKDPADVAELAVYIAGLPTDGTTGQVFSLAGRLL